MPDEVSAVASPPDSIPINPDRVVQGVLNQNAQAVLNGAKWQALAEDLMNTVREQQELIKAQQATIDELSAKPVHAGRVTKKAGIHARLGCRPQDG